MKRCTAHILLIVVLLAFLGCREDAPKVFHAKSLEIDGRYNREITFEPIGVTVAIEQPSVFVRIDDPVSDMDQHQQTILKQLGISAASVWYSNPAEHGRSMHLTFADGKECTFIWVLRLPDERITKISMEHEKYHALSRVSPSGVSVLSEAIKGKGFDINLKDYDEELSATIVQIVSLHLMGIPLDEISGSGLVVEARAILEGSKSNKPSAPYP